MSPTLTRETSEPVTSTALDRIFRTTREYPCEISFPWSPSSPWRWLAAQPHGMKLLWTDRDSRTTIAGWGTAGCVERLPDESTGSVLRRCRELLHGIPSLRMYGGFRFDHTRAIGQEWATFGPGKFWLPRITFDGHMLRLVVRDPTDVEEARSAILASVRDPHPHPSPHPLPLTVCVALADEPSRDQWSAMLRECNRLFTAEILEKIVLVRRRELHFERPVCPYDLLERMTEGNRHSYGFCFQPDERTSFLGISPERLILRRGNAFQSEVLAGTRPRGQNPADDRRLAEELQSSAKEQLEHDIVRKSICQRLHRYVDDLQVDANARLLTLPSMQHLYSSVNGQIKNDVDDGTLMDRLHPTPALGGYPTENAMPEIQRLERFDRGWYGAPVGWVSSDAVEFAVGIRSGLILSRRVFLYSGAGIVPGSTDEAEWLELDQKVRDYMRILFPEDPTAAGECRPDDPGSP